MFALSNLIGQYTNMNDNLQETKGKFNPDIQAVAEISGFKPDTVWRTLTGIRRNEGILKAFDFYTTGKKSLIAEGKLLFRRQASP
jgi:hypothetical protein